MASDGSLGKEICLSFQPSVLIQNFQRTKQKVRAILGKSRIVSSGVNQSVPFGKSIIKRIQFFLLPRNCLIGKIVYLHINQLSHAVPQLNHAFDTALCGFRDICLKHSAVLSVINLAVHKGIAEISNTVIRRNRDSFIFQIFSFVIGNSACDFRNGSMQKLLKAFIGKGQTGGFHAKWPAYIFHFA